MRAIFFSSSNVFFSFRDVLNSLLIPAPVFPPALICLVGLLVPPCPVGLLTPPCPVGLLTPPCPVSLLISPYPVGLLKSGLEAIMGAMIIEDQLRDDGVIERGYFRS